MRRAALMAAIALLAFAAGRATATSRPGLQPDATPLVQFGASTGAPPQATDGVLTPQVRDVRGDAAPSVTQPPETASSLSGIASFVGPSYGSRYLALPEGPGVTVRICGPSACVTRTSTDAGPDKAMQRAGRVADLSFADFGRVCGCDPWVVGVTRVTIARGSGATIPPTSTLP